MSKLQRVSTLGNFNLAVRAEAEGARRQRGPFPRVQTLG